MLICGLRTVLYSRKEKYEFIYMIILELLIMYSKDMNEIKLEFTSTFGDRVVLDPPCC